MLDTLRARWFAFAATVGWGFSEIENAWRDQDNSILAYNLASEKVVHQLKSPSTGQFPGTFEKSDHAGREANGSSVDYTINSWVDAQNGFGGIIRTQWSATVTQTGKDNFLVSAQLQ